MFLRDVHFYIIDSDAPTWVNLVYRDKDGIGRYVHGDRVCMDGWENCCEHVESFGIDVYGSFRCDALDVDLSGGVGDCLELMFIKSGKFSHVIGSDGAVRGWGDGPSHIIEVSCLEV